MTVALHRYSGSEGVVLESVEPRDPRQADGIKLRYAAYVQTRTIPIFGAARGWPSRAYRFRPLRGFTFHHEQAGIAIGMQIGSGRKGVRAWDVDYRIGKHEYRDTFHQGLVLCVIPKAQPLHSC